MAVNIFKDKLRHAQLFGKPALAADQPIPRETVPDGWYCYDMRGTGSNPAAWWTTPAITTAALSSPPSR